MGTIEDRGMGTIEADGRRGADAGAAQIEGWEQSKQTEEGVPTRALQAGSTVSTSVASAMSQDVDRSTPTAASYQKRRATERQA